MTKKLDQLLREVRQDLGREEAAEVDWASVERGLFAHIEPSDRSVPPPIASRAGARAGERATTSARQSPWAARDPRPRASGWRVAFALAMAAGLAVGGRSLMRHPAPKAERAVAPSTQAPSAPGDLVFADGANALVNGAPAIQDQRIGVGDLVEARGGSVTLRRLGKVVLQIEPASRIRVTQLQDTFVVALEQGAVEARVVPVPTGVAFAVDVDQARVAVHGTHFRVQRSDPREMLDLTEGVVSIDDLRSTDRTVVTAPAHAEFLSADAVHTLVVTREASAVRAPVVLQSAQSGGSAITSPIAPKTDHGPDESAAAAGSPSDSHPASTTATGGLTGTNATTATSGMTGANAMTGTNAPTGANAMTAEELASSPSPDTSALLAAAVRDCMADRPHAENVTVVVHSTLYVEGGDDGLVRFARFDPPVAPAVNECAAPGIYKTHLPRGSKLSVPIDFTN